MIYVTGDMHGEHGKLLAAEKEVSLQEGDLLIVCGDFGYIFKDNKQEQLFLDEIETRPYHETPVKGRQFMCIWFPASWYGKHIP